MPSAWLRTPLSFYVRIGIRFVDATGNMANAKALRRAVPGLAAIYLCLKYCTNLCENLALAASSRSRVFSQTAVKNHYRSLPRPTPIITEFSTCFRRAVFVYRRAPRRLHFCRHCLFFLASCHAWKRYFA